MLTNLFAVYGVSPYRIAAVTADCGHGPQRFDRSEVASFDHWQALLAELVDHGARILAVDTRQGRIV